MLLPLAAIAFGAVTSGLPSSAELAPEFAKLELPICAQNGPWCWAFTTVGVVEFEASRKAGHKVQLSPGYLAWAAAQTDPQGSGGSNFGRANRGIDAFGTVTLEQGGVPKGSRIPAPTEEIQRTGRDVGELEFHWIRFWNREEMPKTQLDAIKQDIADGHPVAVGMQWPNAESFQAGTTILNVPDRDKVFDGHCVILTGYKDDPNLPGGGAFHFRNSWGANWADHGYAWMPYALLNFCINDSFSVRIGPKTSPLPPATQTFFAEDLRVTTTNQTQFRMQNMRRFGNAWGEHRQIAYRGSKVGDGFTVKFNTAKAGRYDVRVVITRAQDYGQYSVQLPDRRTSKTIEGAGPGVSRSQPIDLGEHTLRAGETSLSFTLRGQSPASSGMGIGLCEIQLAEK